MLVSVDVYRPAAREQLRVVAEAIKANLYEGKVEKLDTRDGRAAGERSAQGSHQLAAAMS